MPEEDLETSELKESIDERLEEHEGHGHGGHGGHAASGAKHAAGPPAWTRYLSLSTAIIAVIAAVASLESGANSNEAILEKSEAMLAQARASDQWSYYQAKGVKASLAENQAELVADGKPDAAAKLTAKAAKYRAEAEEIQKQAKEHEAEVTERNDASASMMEHHHKFAIAVTLLQIAIALSAIAALTRRKPLWYLGMGVSVGGAVMFVLGLL